MVFALMTTTHPHQIQFGTSICTVSLLNLPYYPSHSVVIVYIYGMVAGHSFTRNLSFDALCNYPMFVLRVCLWLIHMSHSSRFYGLVFVLVAK